MARPKEFDIDQVLDRATELFWTKGYEETSMRDLEEGLGVGRQSLYSTFGDKRDLFLAALDRYSSLQQERIEPLLAPDAGLAAIRAYFARAFSPSSVACSAARGQSGSDATSLGSGAAASICAMRR